MLIPRLDPFPPGYTEIVSSGGAFRNMILDFGILVLEAGEQFVDVDLHRERAYLLITGDARLVADSPDGGFADSPMAVSRRAPLDEPPWTIHVSCGSRVEIAAKTRCEFAVEAVGNPKRFAARIYEPREVRSERFGAGTLKEASTRTVRTVFDASTHRDSAMVLGEVINHPGRWSSFPPHSHEQPEIYHYRFFPTSGFGYCGVGESVYRVTDLDTVAIPGGVTHPQVAAPGYAMYYIWMIPHLPGNRFGPDSRVFDQDHQWLLDPDAPIWNGSGKESMT
jgi:5-deoxy-glucuronate isomerase